MQQSGNTILLHDTLQIKLSQLYDEYEALIAVQENMKEIVFTYAVPIYFNYDNFQKAVVDSALYFSPQFTNVLLGLGGNVSTRKGKIIQAKEKLEEIKYIVVAELTD